MARLKGEDSTLIGLVQGEIGKRGDAVRGLLQRTIQEVLEEEMTAYLNAEPYTRTEERRGYRNGYKPRTLLTRIGRLELMAPNVIVQAFKRAGDGEGVIVRLREIAGKATEVSLSSPLFPAGNTAAMLTGIFEMGGKPCRVSGNSVTVQLKGFGIETVRITAQP
jgi:alpha-mannosidase